MFNDPHGAITGSLTADRPPRTVPVVAAPGRRETIFRSCLPSLVALLWLTGCDAEFAITDAQLRAARQSHDAERLERALETIRGWHLAQDTGLARRLRPGVDAATISAAFVGEPCQPTEALETLWRWRDGEDGVQPFVWYHDFLSHAEAAAEYRSLRRDPLIRWDPHYVPVFAFEGEWYAAYCGPRSRRAGPLVHYFIEDEPRVAYANLTTYLETQAAALDSGAVSWRDGAMHDDIGAISRLHRQHNPGLPFPYHVPSPAAGGAQE